MAGEQAQRNILIPENRVLILENRAETVPQNVGSRRKTGIRLGRGADLMDLAHIVGKHLFTAVLGGASLVV